MLRQLGISLLLLAIAAAVSTDSASPTVRFELIHRHGHPTWPGPRSRFGQVQELLASDARRSKAISEMLGRRRRRAWEVPTNVPYFKMPISSGAYAGTGQYFVRFRVGTPAQSFLLVADTGSDLTWMSCRYRCQNCRRNSRRRVFDADRSRTFRPVNCSSALCKNELPFSLSSCPSPSSNCNYDYRYEDGSRAEGFFARESATVTLSTGEKAKLKNVVVGCTGAFGGSSFREADGVLGLGYSRHSFAAAAAAKLDGRFSYCLVDHLSQKNVSSFLAFGRTPVASLPRMRYTTLAVRQPAEPFYSLEVTAISVGSKRLAIPRAVWNLTGSGGAILDSGTSLTVLVEPAYRAVMAALSEPLGRLPRLDLQPFDFCFNATEGLEEAAVPRLAVHLSGGARFEPPVKSYVVDVAEGVKCLGFLSTPWPGVSTIGNILQQNFLWEFDVENMRLGFQPSSCASRD